MKDILILGVGNEILTDDGIGPKLVDALAKEINSPNVCFEKASLGGLELLEMIQGYNKVIFIDAIKTKDGIPGDVYIYSPSDFKETLHLSHIHDVSFLTALKFGEDIGLQVPQEIKIIAIEIVEDLVFSNNYSPEIEKRYQEIYSEVILCVNEFISELEEK